MYNFIYLSLESTVPQDISIVEDSVNQTFAMVSWIAPECTNGDLLMYQIGKNDDIINVTDSLTAVMFYSFTDLEPNSTYIIQARSCFPS